MKTHVRTIGIIGLGLIGTSVGMALKKARSDIRIIGLTRSEKSGNTAKKMGAVDSLVRTVTELLADTDVIILSTPIPTTMTMLGHIGILTKKPVLVTDTGSTKEEICTVARDLPARVSFIGGHPFAGKEVSGPEHADAGLFIKRPWILTPSTGTEAGSLKIIESIVHEVGANPVCMTPGDHDRLAASVSHLPLVVSTLLMEAAASGAEWPRERRLAGSGFYDTTRLSGGNPAMHAAILQTNKTNVLAKLQQFERALTGLKNDITAERWSVVEEKLQSTQRARISWERSRI